MKIYQNSDVDINILKNKKIGIIGYGNQGRAQALNLLDSDLNVQIGLRRKSDSIDTVGIVDATPPIPLRVATNYPRVTGSNTNQQPSLIAWVAATTSLTASTSTKLIIILIASDILGAK